MDERNRFAPIQYPGLAPRFAEDDILFIQHGILQFTGILPGSVRPPTFQYNPHRAIIRRVLIFGGWIHVCLLLIQTCASLLGDGPAGPTDMPLLNAMITISPTVIAWRGVFLLSVFIFKTKNWSVLMQETDDLIAMCFSNASTLKGHLRTWRLMVVSLTLYTILITLTVQVLRWNWNVWYGIAKNYAYSPVPIPLNVWQQGVIAEFLETLPRFLSQQVMVGLIGFCLILRSCLIQVNATVANCTRFVELGNSPSEQKLRISRLDCLETELVYAMHLHSRIFKVVEKINEMFGLVFAAAYCFDLIAAVGMVAGLVLNSDISNSDPRDYLPTLGPLTVLIVNVTFFLIPAISMHEQVGTESNTLGAPSTCWAATCCFTFSTVMSVSTKRFSLPSNESEQSAVS